MVEFEKPRPKRKWQNLFHQKCPNCDTQMDDKGNYLICPNLNEDDPSKNCFFINKEKAAGMLLDPEHPAHFCLSDSEKEKINEAIEGMGLEEVLKKD